MRLPSFTICGLIVLMSILLVSGRAASSNETELICRPFGTCEPCPEDALREPFCQPFGNRRLTHCVPNTPGHAPSDGTSEHDAPGDDVLHGQPGLDSPHGEIPAWESCGRIVEQERADFYEFFACNFVIAVIALFVLFARTKRLQAMHARQLAARIGLVRGTPGGWVNG